MATQARALNPVAPTRTIRRPTVRTDLKRVREYRSLVWYLVSSGLRTERTGTLFGMVWWILDPVLLMLVYWFLFVVVFHRTEPYFPLFILVSLVSWEAFAKSTQRSIATTLARERSMKQVNFPRSVIPIAISFAEFVHFLTGMSFAVIAGVFMYGLVPTKAVLLVIPVGLAQLAFTLGMSFLLSALNFFVRDVAHLLTYLFRFWYLISPGIYAITRIPEKYRGVYSLNPFVAFFGTYHAAFLGTPAPSLDVILYTCALSVAVLVLAYAFYVRVAPHFSKLSS